MSTITKEKNILVIIGHNTNRRYTFDINTGVLYGCSGKALKTKPSEVTSFSINNSPIFAAYHFLIERCTTTQISSNNRCIKLLAFADTLTSLGYTTRDVSIWEMQNFNDAIFDKKETLKEVLNFFKKEKEEGKVITYNNYIDAKIIAQIETSIKQCDLTNEEKELIYYIFRRGNVKIKIPVLISYLKFLMPFYNENPYDIERKLMEYISMCNDLNWKPKKGDFGSLYVQVKLTYELNKQKVESEKLERNQPKNLFFEDENFTVIIPVTGEEFKAEAEAQSNCVYRAYLPEVLNGRTNIVFIRKKTDIENSYITCEVYEGKIKQYLAKFNSHVYDDKALEFKKKYQDYLNTLTF